MVLQKQLVQIPFGGLQTKADPKVAPIGTYQVIDNMVMQQYPELVKRDGLTLIGEITSPSDITTSYNYINEIGAITTKGLYSYSPSLDQFQSKGNTSSPVITADPIIANTYTQLNCDITVTSNNILGSIWEDSRGGVRVTIKDTISDTFLQSDHSISVTGSKPKVMSIEGQIVFFWTEAGLFPGDAHFLYAQQYNTLTNTFYNIVEVNHIMSDALTYDVTINLDAVLIVASTTSVVPNSIIGFYYNPKTHAMAAYPDGLPPPTTFTFANSGILPSALSLAVDPTDIFVSVTIYNDSNEVWTKTFFPTIQGPTLERQVYIATDDPGWALSSCVDSSTNLYIFFSSFDTQHNSFRAKLTDVNSALLVDYAEPFILQMGVVSKTFFFSENAYVVLGYDSNLQSTYFGLRDDGACYARFFTQVAGGNINKANCVSSYIPLPSSPNTYIVSLLQITQVVSSANSYFTKTSVFAEQIYFTPSDIDNQVAGNVLNISGGYLKQYDGTPTVYEQGFHLYPETPALEQSDTMDGGLTLLGSYAYILCWEWRDNYGQIYRSETSIPIEVVLTGTNNTVTLTVPTLPLTDKQTRFSDTRTPVVLAVYRTQSLGTIYYRVNQLPESFVFNDTEIQTIEFIDTFSDIEIGTNALLYTTGGVFTNTATPAANLMAISKNRVVLAGIDTYPQQVFYSKEIEEGVGVEFSRELSFIVDSFGGKITALAAMDDKIIMFKKSSIFYVAGALLDKVGNGTPPYPLLVASDCGCTNPQSIVLTGLGIMFQSPKGIYLVDRQLNVTYIGQQVDRITNPSTGPIMITSAVNLPDKNLVYFTDSNNNQVLVYDTYFQQWYTYSLQFSPISATLLDSSVYFSSSSNMFRSIPNQPNDGASSIISTVKTNWISLAQMEGFQRIYAIMILGDNASLKHTLNVNLYYDFEQYPRETLKITPTLLESAPWGSDATWGSNTPWGGTSPLGAIFDGVYQFVVRPREQKCSSIQIEIFDSFPNGDRSQSFKFSGISLVAGIKQGWNKGIPFTQRLT